MKKWTSLFDTMRFPIKILFIGFLLIQIGEFIQNKNVNIFYNITNIYTTTFSDIVITLGRSIVYNFPLITLIRIVSRKEKSGTPILMGVLGYLTFLTVSIFINQSSINTISFSSILNVEFYYNGNIKYPVNLGLVGVFVVGFITRYSYVKSRRRNPYSIVSFLNKESVGYLYNIVFNAFAAVAIFLLYPYFLKFIDFLVNYIAKDINGFNNLFIYGFFEKILSVLNLGHHLKIPFWYGQYGGSISTFSGKNILGDVNIWAMLLESNNISPLYGRFITPYYVLNMFIAPAILLFLYTSYTDYKEKRRHLITFLVLMIVSFVYGNALPLEIGLLFLAPLYFVFHVVMYASLFSILNYFSASIGFSYSGSTLVASPGVFPDYIILLRNNNFYHSIIVILVVGIIYAVIYFIVGKIYLNYLSYDFLIGINKRIVATNIINGVGGYDNILKIHSSPFKLTLTLKDRGLIAENTLLRLNISKITINNDNMIAYCGIASRVIHKQINSIIDEHRRVR